MMIKHLKNQTVDRIIHLAIRYLKGAKVALTKEHEKLKREIVTIEHKIKMANTNHIEESTIKKLQKKLQSLKQQNDQLEATFAKLALR